MMVSAEVTLGDTHTSAIEFWMGVPVSSRRLRQFIDSSVFHRVLDELLMAWASSRTMYCQLTRLKYLASWIANW
jgi:hypothetical protein